MITENEAGAGAEVEIPVDNGVLAEPMPAVADTDEAVLLDVAMLRDGEVDVMRETVEEVRLAKLTPVEDDAVMKGDEVENMSDAPLEVAVAGTVVLLVAVGVGDDDEFTIAVDGDDNLAVVADETVVGTDEGFAVELETLAQESDITLLGLAGLIGDTDAAVDMAVGEIALELDVLAVADEIEKLLGIVEDDGEAVAVDRRVVDRAVVVDVILIGFSVVNREVVVAVVVDPTVLLPARSQQPVSGVGHDGFIDGTGGQVKSEQPLGSQPKITQAIESSFRR